MVVVQLRLVSSRWFWKGSWFLKQGPIICPTMSITNEPAKTFSHTAAKAWNLATQNTSIVKLLSDRPSYMTCTSCPLPGRSRAPSPKLFDGFQLQLVLEGSSPEEESIIYIHEYSMFLWEIQINFQNTRCQPRSQYEFSPEVS